MALRLFGLTWFKRVRAIGTTTWSYMMCLLVSQAPALLHHGGRALHFAIAVVRK